MKTMASFCYKFTVIENKKKRNCRIIVELIEKSNKSFQVVTYMYKGHDIIRTNNSILACYLYCNDIFYRRIEKNNITKLIVQYY